MRQVRLPAAVALVALLATGLMARHDPTIEGEAAVFEAINGWPGALEWPMEIVMQLGWAWVGVPLVGVAAGLATRSRRAGLTVAVAGLVSWAITDVLKEVFDRARPSAGVVHLVSRSHAHGYGFPSGHTAVATGLLVSFALIVASAPCRADPVERAVVSAPWLPVVVGFIGAVAVGVARIYVGVHYPLDVVGGWAIGCLSGIAIGSLDTASSKQMVDVSGT